MRQPGTLNYPPAPGEEASATAREPELVEFVFWISWEEDTPQGPSQLYARQRTFRNVQIALSEHHEACKGGWVARGMHRPYVSELWVFKDGRKLLEERRPKKLLPEFGEVSS